MSNRLTLEPWAEADGVIELAATLDVAGKSQRLWWRVPAAWRDALTTGAEPFVIGLIFPMMAAGGEVEIDGPVSSSLLANLETFADLWRMWLPDRYRPVRAWSREESEPPEPAEPGVFAIPFSSGVDSCFTAWRHVRGLAGRNGRRIGCGVTMLGFDVRPEQPNAGPMYAAIASSAARMLASIDVPHVEISTNFRALDLSWTDGHATQLASGLALLGRRFGGALIPNSLPANQLGTRLGSHPLSDPFLSSTQFQIVDDGAAVQRWAKCEAIASWPEAMAALRVCHGRAGNVGNCGRCEKCVRTAVAFRIANKPPPPGLAGPIPPAAWRAIRLRRPVAVGYWRELAEGFAARGRSAEPFAREVDRVLRRTERVALSKSIRQRFVPIRNCLRQLMRGTSESRRQLAAKKLAVATEVR